MRSDKRLALRVIKRNCDGDNVHRTTVFTVEDLITYYERFVLRKEGLI